MSVNPSELTASSQLMPQSVSELWEPHFQDIAQRMNSGHCHTCETFFSSQDCSHYVVWQPPPHSPSPLTHSILSFLNPHEVLSNLWKHSSAFSLYSERIQSAIHACHRPCLLVYSHTDSLSFCLLSSHISCLVSLHLRTLNIFSLIDSVQHSQRHLLFTQFSACYHLYKEALLCHNSPFCSCSL